jgi:acyl-[acyl carrier protein]--UDP-N-acetylglucosamine O-acyltransferase
MRVLQPALNNEWYDDEYLKVFGFPKMGKNVKVHKTVVLPSPPSISIGSNVTINPFCVLTGTIVFGNDVVVGAHCVFDAPLVTIGDGAKLAPHGVWVSDKPMEVKGEKKDDRPAAGPKKRKR